MDDRGLQTLREALEEERTRGEELTRLLRQLQRDSEAEVAAVNALLQGERQRSIALQAALQRQGQALLAAFEVRTKEALHREHALRDEIQTLHRTQRKQEEFTADRFYGLEADLALERRKNCALEENLAVLKQSALNQLMEKEHAICRLGREVEELKVKLENAEHRVVQVETFGEKLGTDHQLLARENMLQRSDLRVMGEGREDECYQFLNRDKENILQSEQCTMNKTDDHFLSKPVCITDISNCSFLSDQSKKKPRVTEDSSLTHSLEISQFTKRNSGVEAQLPLLQPSLSALSDAMEGTSASMIVRTSTTDMTLEALRLELCAKEWEVSVLSAEKLRLEEEVTAISRRYFALATAYDAVKEEKERIDSELLSLREDHDQNEETIALSTSAAITQLITERELLACEKDAARTELAAVQDAWSNERLTLQQALTEVEQQVIHTNVKYAEAATELEVQKRLLRDAGKQGKRRSTLFSLRKT